VKVCLFQTPPPPGSFSIDCDEEENISEETPQSSTSRGSEFVLNVTSTELQKIAQQELSYLIKNPELSKNKAELLSSALQQWNLWDVTVKVTVFGPRRKDLEQFFTR
jgi:hypothetical protein